MKTFGLRLGVAFMVVSLMASVALAQETTGAVPAPVTPPAAVAPASNPAAPAPEVKKPVELSAELSLFMEVYFVQLKAKAFAKTYALTSADLKKTMKLTEFTKMLTASRLTDFTSKIWVDKQWDPKTGLINLRGEFTAGEGDKKEVHTVTFQLVKKGETYEVLGITETLSLQLLGSMFPKEAALQAFVRNELTGITQMIKRGSFRKFYNGMAKTTRATVKFSAFNKALKAFKKEKKDISLADDATITMSENFPKIDGNGNVTVKGEYANAKYVVFFTLGYNYEWEWKLNTLNINPVLLAEADKVRADMAAAVKKAEEEAAKKAADEAAAQAAKKAADEAAAKVEEKK